MFVCGREVIMGVMPAKAMIRHGCVVCASCISVLIPMSQVLDNIHCHRLPSCAPTKSSMSHQPTHPFLPGAGTRSSTSIQAPGGPVIGRLKQSCAIGGEKLAWNDYIRVLANLVWAKHRREASMSGVRQTAHCSPDHYQRSIKPICPTVFQPLYKNSTRTWMR